MPPSAGYYPVDDMPDYILKIKSKEIVKKRKLRKDLKKGQICVITDGQFIGKRIIYLTNIENYAICIGPRSINDVGLFKIDERFLFKINYFINFDFEFKNEDFKNVLECKMEIISDFRNDESEIERILEVKILKEVSKVRYLKAYLKELFVIPGKDALGNEF